MPLKIVYHHRTRGEDAQGIHVHELCQAFEELGHQVLKVAPLARRSSTRSSGSLQGNSLFGLGVPHALYELMAMAYNLVAFIVLSGAILRFRPHFIYERYSLFCVSGLLMARLLRKPFILEVNAPLSMELDQHGGLVFRRLAQGVENWLIQNADKTIVVTSAMAQIFVDRGIPREKLLVMPNGVNRDMFHAGVDGTLVRDRYGFQASTVIGFVGWIRPWHGVDGLLAAAPRLCARFPEARFLIVGEGPALLELKEQVARQGLEDKIIFTGSVPREGIPAHIAAMDIAVQPDVTSYASPIKLFEYLAIGRAVVAPEKPNITEVVDSRVAALFPERDWPAMEEALAALLVDQDRRREMGRCAAERVIQQGYHWQANAARVVDLVERAH
ncbi:glycosyltransferase family 4 protein [Ectothiorhodospira marina]|uniref:glycosyltransferase family 4 protein n=1 Tax=Ectothiorhodospira marina TaxID=1396821 RepID=UPI003CCBB10F